MNKILLAVTLAAALAACSTPSTDNDAFNALAAQAENEIREAEKVGFLWRDTEQLLADARQANRQGRHDEAMKLAQKALKQAELAQQQAKDNAKAGPSYPN